MQRNVGTGHLPVGSDGPFLKAPKNTFQFANEPRNAGFIHELAVITYLTDKKSEVGTAPWYDPIRLIVLGPGAQSCRAAGPEIDVVFSFAPWYPSVRATRDRAQSVLGKKPGCTHTI